MRRWRSRGRIFPWDPVTGQSKPMSGIWQPEVFFEGDTGFAYLDAALHANPPTKTVVYEGPGYAWGRFGFSRLRIDTTKLTDGPHKLLIGTCNIEDPRRRPLRNAGHPLHGQEPSRRGRCARSRVTRRNRC